jgi:diguanylate cyclase (GGDEF)-like protein
MTSIDSEFMFENIPLGMIVLDSDVVVVDANDYVFRYFNENKKDLTGQMFGNMFHCSSLTLESEVCGQTDECPYCDFRNSILSLLQSGEEVKDIELQHTFKINGRKSMKWFIVNAAKVIKDGEVMVLVALSDITEMKNTEAELIKLGITDELTGLYNRRYILKMFNEMLEDKQTGKEISLAMVDIDKFKNVNDQYGHVVGDLVLKKLAEICKKYTRKDDYFGRYGGEEFLLIFSDTEQESAEKVIKRIADRFRVSMSGVVDRELTFSAGLISIRDIEKRMSSTEYINQADQLLYRAKEKGRDRIEKMNSKFGEV